ASSTASNAWRFAWTSATIATRIARAGALLARLVRAVELGEVLDPLARLPLRVVVLHRVDQLAHETRREVDARDDDAGDLVVHAREGDRELVLRVAHVREVRVDPGHDLRGEVDVDVALAVFVVHGS